MSEWIKVAVDAMGGDYAVDAVNDSPELFVWLVGKESLIRQELDKYTYPADRIQVVDAPEVIETGEPPVKAIQKKKESSLVKALKLVRSCSGGRPGTGGQDQGCGAGAVGAADSHSQRGGAFD